MNPKFYANNYGELRVEMEGQEETLITTKFMTSENKTKAADYLRTVAEKLNETYTADPEAAAEILETAENKIADAQLAEKFLEPVTF
jgi:dsDNA-specific endonuclease/ATPase MutS2